VKLLLDSHAFVFMCCDPDALSHSASTAMEDPANEIYLSVATSWEMQIKAALGKLRLRDAVCNLVQVELGRGTVRMLPIELAHIDELSRLPPIHRDPFDRMLIAQARVEGLSIVTRDGQIRRYPVDTVWD
jgi:PIN domain nuclease of toxin-antitoxin system